MGLAIGPADLLLTAGQPFNTVTALLGVTYKRVGDVCPVDAILQLQLVMGLDVEQQVLVEAHPSDQVCPVGTLQCTAAVNVLGRQCDKEMHYGCSKIKCHPRMDISFISPLFWSNETPPGKDILTSKPCTKTAAGQHQIDEDKHQTTASAKTHTLLRFFTMENSISKKNNKYITAKNEQPKPNGDI